MFKLSQKSLKKLEGVHPDLVKVVKRAIELTKVDFLVSEGLRTIERQKILVADGKSKTMNSRHLTGHAVDLIPLVSGKIAWDCCQQVKDAMFKSANESKVKIRWGGDWDGDGDSKDEKFYDGPHFELRRQEYP